MSVAMADTISDMVTLGGSIDGMLLARRYRVVRQLGQGGMGSVWLVEDVQLDGKQFAVKMLPSILFSNKRAYKQLKEEALLSMRLTHPNIVTLRAFEENGGNPFLVMDYIDGLTLDDYLADKGSLSEAEAVRVLRPVAAALDYAHGEGVVHRDIKPANVMIRRDGHPFVLDFGIAREIQETLTRVTGKLSSGTLLYMSPEQLHGASPKKEQDIYSFAAMAYECLSGKPPFCRGQIEYQIDNDLPESLPAGLGIGASVMRGLAKAAAARPATCMAVLEKRVVGAGGAAGVPRTAYPVRQRTVPVRVAPPVPQRAAAVPQRRAAVSEPVAPQRGGSRAGGGRGLIALACVAVVLVVLAVLSVKKSGPFAGRRRSSGAVAVQSPKPPPRWNAPKPDRPVTAGGDVTNVPPPSPSPLPPVHQPDASAEAAAVRKEAASKQSLVARLSDEDGFRQKKADLSGVLTRANVLYNGAKWADSARQYTNYVMQCEALVRLDGERREADARRSVAVSAKGKAEGAAADKLAKRLFDAAMVSFKEGQAAWEGMSFSRAGSCYKAAADRFVESVAEAVAERARRKATAERKRSAALQRAEGARKAGAMTYAPKAWNVATTNAWQFGDIAFAKGDYDAAVAAFDKAENLYEQAVREAEASKARAMASRRHAYEVTILPYVNEAGGQRSVAATCECSAVAGVARFENGRNEIVLGSDSERDIEGAVRVRLEYNGREARFWLTADDFRRKAVKSVCMD